MCKKSRRQEPRHSQPEIDLNHPKKQVSIVAAQSLMTPPTPAPKQVSSIERSSARCSQPSERHREGKTKRTSSGAPFVPFQNPAQCFDATDRFVGTEHIAYGREVRQLATGVATA
jgi:hypothetical protein